MADVAARVATAEREVADLLPIEAAPVEARRVLAEVPYWFHTFALNRTDGIYTPGTARDHRYRVPAIPEDFGGLRVLDVGSFDGFYAFLAEARGARRVIAVDNEQYVHWVRDRSGVELEGGEGFRAIRGLLGSRVEYRRLDALELDRFEQEFDLILCFGILHRVEAPGGLLQVLRGRLARGGQILLETHGVFDADGKGDGAPPHAYGPGEVYRHDDYVYWGFGAGALDRLAREAGFVGFELGDAPVIDGHPRLLGTVNG